jgi:hypothetical protein
MSKKILLQDSNFDDESILDAYREAAECDEYLFGDYDYCKDWVSNNDYIEEQ